MQDWEILRNTCSCRGARRRRPTPRPRVWREQDKGKETTPLGHQTGREKSGVHEDGSETDCGVNYRDRARSRNRCPESGYVTVETLATTEGVVPRGIASPGHKGPPPLTSNDPSLRSALPLQRTGPLP